MIIFSQPQLLMREDVQDLLYFYARMMFGSGAGVHPSIQGHKDVAEDVFNALRDGRSGKEDAEQKQEELTDLALGLLLPYMQEKYPDLYESIVGAKDMDDLDIIIEMLKMSNNAALEGVECPYSRGSRKGKGCCRYAVSLPRCSGYCSHRHRICSR